MGSNGHERKSLKEKAQEIVVSISDRSIYAFHGSIDFESTVTVKGGKAKHKARLNYHMTPQGKYFDPKMKTEMKGVYSSVWSFDMQDEERDWFSIPAEIFANMKKVAEDEVETGVLDEYLNELIDKDVDRQQKEARAAA